MKTETAKNKIHKPEKVLNQNLADQKAALEAEGWKFYAPKTITEENQVPDNTEVVFEREGKTYEGYIFDTAFDKTQYLIKAEVGGIVSNFYLKPGEFEVKNPQAENSAVFAVFDLENSAIEFLTDSDVSPLWNDGWKYEIRGNQIRINAIPEGVKPGNYEKEFLASLQALWRENSGGIPMNAGSTYSWLKTCPPSDTNFKINLEKADAETIRKVLADVPPEGNKSRIERLEARLRKLEKNKKPDFTPDVKPDEKLLGDIPMTLAKEKSELDEKHSGEARDAAAVGGFGDEKTSAEAGNPLTLEQTARISDWMEKGWTIQKGGKNVWKAEKTFDEKPVVVTDLDLDEVFRLMEQFEPKKEEPKLKPSETLPETEIKKVRFTLTDEDVKLKTNALMDVLSVLDTKKAALADIKKEYKKAIEALEKEQDELVDQIRSRVEYRPVECLIEYDLERGEAVYFRPDTQEQTDRRSMTKDELRIALAAQERAKQRELFG